MIILIKNVKKIPDVVKYIKNELDKEVTEKVFEDFFLKYLQIAVDTESGSLLCAISNEGELLFSEHFNDKLATYDKEKEKNNEIYNRYRDFYFDEEGNIMCAIDINGNLTVAGEIKEF